MKWFATALVVVAAVLVVATPASANSIPTTGSQLRLFGPVTTFPANTPFYVEQGFIVPLADDGIGMHNEISAQASSTLYLDGVQQPSQVDIDVVDGSIERRWLTNYPNGLPAGEHTFVDVFTFPLGTSTQVKTVTFS
ncbi:MAG TPA: hypothetical protein VGP69_14490 [Gaiellaceae bacterium]|jgi:hypothetical protein|nr:hypothetical protein [Gaiellaceae bacterium]